jgi:tetratricopeptide (TPR) repeat protein
MKKVVLISIMMSTGFAAFGFDINYRGMMCDASIGAGAGGFSGYNNTLAGERDLYASEGYNADLSGVDASAILNWGVMALFDTSFAGETGAGLSEGYMRAGTKGTVYYQNGSVMEKRDIFLSYYSIELRARKYFELAHGFKAFGGLRAGLFMAVNNYIEAETYDGSGNLEKAVIEDINGVVPGASLEAGLEYSLNGETGVFLDCGLRASSGDRQASFRSNDLSVNATAATFNSDFSGVYAETGIYYKFLPDERKNIKQPGEHEKTLLDVPTVAAIKTAAVSTTPNPTATETAKETSAATAAVLAKAKATAKNVPLEKTSYEKEKRTAPKKNPTPVMTPVPRENFAAEGDAEFLKSDYSGAAELYKQAAGIKADAVTYKKLGNCYYYMNNISEAVRYYSKSLELNIEDTKLKKFLDGLK